jgi:hypothetical protein
MMDDDECGAIGGMSSRGILYTTKPTSSDLGWNLGRRVANPTTNRLS